MTSLLRVAPDDPDYLALAAAEAEFWERMHPCGLEAVERTYSEGPVDCYYNRRFTGDEHTHWSGTIARRGRFRSGAILGTSSLLLESHILQTNPTLHLTFFDIAEGALERRHETLGRRFPGRVETHVADLNFLTLATDAYDLIASSSTIHHVTNLEALAVQINRALTPNGLFFLEDYVGEERFRFSADKKRIYTHVLDREHARQGLPPANLIWRDDSDLSPFCGVRSHEILPVFRHHLTELEVRTAGALLTPVGRSRPSNDGTNSPWVSDDWLRLSPWRLALGMARKRFPRLLGRNRSMQHFLGTTLLQELFVLSDVLTDLDLLQPGLAFATYAKRR